MAREINLVPDVKEEMIKALKLRNFILFLCIVVASASVAISLILFTIAGTQQMAVDGKKEMIGNYSSKVKSYGDLTDFLTIKDQLSDLQDISSNKKVLSRTFGILSALLPSGPDTITISGLSIILSDEDTSYSFDAQANANREPKIDYNVLDSFKKSLQFMRYDYGRYVDKEGSIIPTYCIIESGLDGATFNDADHGIYAFWTIDAEGCNPSKTNSESSEKTTSDSMTELTSDNTGYSYEEYGDQRVVRIWRTPQFADWYNKKYMTKDGTISNVPHFQSSCTTYSASEDEKGNMKWSSANNSCLLVPNGIEGINITDSSNGRVGETEELVLRFSARISLNPEVYKFSNKHMLAIGPEGRHNVTDSYTQIQAMFSERAADCDENDEACKGEKQNG